MRIYFFFFPTLISLLPLCLNEQSTSLEIGTINNSEARQLLKLPDHDVSYISKLFKEMLNSGDIEIDSTIGNNKNIYRRKR